MRVASCIRSRGADGIAALYIAIGPNLEGQIVDRRQAVQGRDEPVADRTAIASASGSIRPFRDIRPAELGACKLSFVARDKPHRCRMKSNAGGPFIDLDGLLVCFLAQAFQGESIIPADRHLHMNLGQILLGLIFLLTVITSPLAYGATRIVLQEELLSETQSNALIGTGDVAFSKQDYGAAMRSYLAASGDKDPAVRAGALNRIGTLYERALGVPQDYGRARDYFLKAAELGNGYAQANVGDLYFFGLSVPRNIDEALKWYRKGADQDAPLGLNQTGWFYLQGIGLQKDPAEAMKWYRRSADLGSPNAAYMLGWIYGHVEPMDYVKAMTWYRKAASHNQVEAQNNIGTLFEKGLGVPQDYVQAANWYQLASDAGYARSQFHLGELYFTGRGVKQDATTARALMLSAAQGGDGDAQEWLHLHP